MTRLVPPTIHSNGTSKKELVELRVAVTEAAQALLDAMKLAAPNARDYYPQGHEALSLARAAWLERMEAVERLQDEVQRDAMKIALEGL